MRIKYKCNICKKIINNRIKELIKLCKFNKIGVCSIECFNEWEAELYNKKESNL